MNITPYILVEGLPRLILGEHEGKVCLCDWDLPERKAIILRRIKRYLSLTEQEIRIETTPLLEEVKAYLDAYKSGSKEPFRLPLLLLGTPFQQTVWQALATIPYGTTCSYQQFAQQLHNERAIRAIARAVGQNPMSILLPCHRIIGSDGRLTGYAGGLKAKELLLDVEGTNI